LKVDIGQGYTHGETNKTPEFLAKFASGKIPAFETPDGFYLFEGKAIQRYVAKLANLLGKDDREAALIDQWVSYVDDEIVRNYMLSIRLCLGFLTPYSKPIDTQSREKGAQSLELLEKHLTSNTFFVGERITLADIMAANVIQSLYKRMLDGAWRDAHPNIRRHYETVVNQPKLREIFGETEYCEKALQFTPPPKPAKDVAPKAEAPKKEVKPKKTEEDDEDDDVVKEEPKAKNPLDSLPKSEFNLEDWKRAYSNMDTRGPGGSIEWFHSKFDKEGFSTWRVDFKYNDELTQTFMSSNQIGGFFNRLEASRKYLFGSVGVLGTANNSMITGVLICRGKDIKPVVDVAPDFESYEYKKLDLGNSKDKEFFEAALAWDLEVGNLKWADGKNFK